MAANPSAQRRRGGPRLFSFQKRCAGLRPHCVSCHDYGKKAATLNLSGDPRYVFSNSFVDLWALGVLTCVARPAEVQQAIRGAASVADIQIVLDGHAKVC
jgi:hypothetical protein